MEARLEETFREEWSRVLAVLVRLLGDFHAAEEATQDAFAVAAECWPRDGLPHNPRAWLVTTARRKAIDRIRRARRITVVAEPVGAETPWSELDTEAIVPDHIPDERLALIFTCCHPALSSEAQVALTLRAVGGMSTREIAAAFLVSEQTMKRRLSRARTKIRDAAIPFAVPPESTLVDRLDRVLAVIYLIFTTGYRGSAELSAEAIRLGRLLADLMPDEAEVAGLLSLMLMQESRREARERDGVLIPLLEQERGQWSWTMVAEALQRLASRRHSTGSYLLQARIAAAYFQPSVPWRDLLGLYDQLLLVIDSPVVRLNRAVVVAELDGAEAALRLLDGLEMPGYPWFHSTRAELLTRLDRVEEARAAYCAALEQDPPAADAEFLRVRLDALTTDS